MRKARLDCNFANSSQQTNSDAFLAPFRGAPFVECESRADLEVCSPLEARLAAFRRQALRPANARSNKQRAPRNNSRANLPAIRRAFDHTTKCVHSTRKEALIRASLELQVFSVLHLCFLRRCHSSRPAATHFDCCAQFSKSRFAGQ